MRSASSSSARIATPTSLESSGAHDTAVLLNSNLLAAGAFDLEKRKALDSFVRQRFFDLVKFERFEDRFNLLHHARPAILPQPARLELLIVVLAQLLWRVRFFRAQAGAESLFQTADRAPD